MTTRAIKVKGEKLSFLAHADEAEQLVTGTLTGETPTGWNFKVKGTYIHWVDNDGNERRKEGTLTGESRDAGSITVHGELLYYGDYDGDERSVQEVVVFEHTDNCHRMQIASVWYWSNDMYYISVGQSGPEGWEKRGGGIRFENITIPQGATINSAYFILQSYDNYIGSGTKSYVTGEDVDNAVEFTTEEDYLNRDRTTAKVAWDDIPRWYMGVDYNSPEIASIIQEIVNRVGWVSGNDIVIFWDDHDGRSSTVGYRIGRNFNSTPPAPIKLLIEF